MSAPPPVSVCVPCWNGVHYLPEALASLRSQTFGDFELLVLDDASTDGTPELVAACGDSRLRLERNPRRLGLPANWNRSMELARASWIKFLFQDDLLAPDALARLLEAVRERASSALAFGRREIRVEGTHPLLGADYARLLRAFLARRPAELSGLALVAQALDQRRPLTTNVVGEPSFVLLRRESALRAGGFDVRLRQLPDWDLWLRLADESPLAFVDADLGVFRLHAGGQTAANLARPELRREELAFVSSLARRYGPSLTPTQRGRLRRTLWRARLASLRARLGPQAAPEAQA